METRIGDLFEGTGMSLGWEHNHHTLLGEQLLGFFDRPYEVAISRDQQSDVESVLKSIGEQLDCNVHVGHFLVVCGIGVATVPASDWLGQVVSKIDVKIGQRA
jgi:hypothetical protein